MTVEYRSGEEGSAFSRWVRSNPKLDSVAESMSITDGDYIFHKFFSRNEKNKPKSFRSDEVDHFMIVELKIFDAHPSYAQRDTLDVMDQLLRKATINKVGVRRTVKIEEKRYRRGLERWVRFYGVHLLQLSSDEPTSSDTIRWDGKKISVEKLEDILRYHLDPDRPSKLLDTRRHHRITPKQWPLL